MFYSSKTRGIIIKRIKYGEADRVLTVFTEDLGKIQVLARGIRRGKSKLAGILELFNLVQLELVRGRNLDVVIGAHALNNFLGLKTDFKKVSFAHFSAEFIDKFTEERGTDRRLYALFRDLFLNLDKFAGKKDYLWALILDEWRMLEYLGVMPRLYHCAGCGLSLSDAKILSLGEGGLYCANCASRAGLSDPVREEVVEILLSCGGRYVRQPAGIGRTRWSAPTGDLEQAGLVLAYFLSASLAPRIKSWHFLKKYQDYGKTRTPVH
ncbi:MAG: DNA repair protein RecO [Patescibacteria group bacterium]|nr:DNA repair protein RecO [Patescibacteria group bacterium]